MPTYNNSGTITLANTEGDNDHDFKFRSPGAWKVSIGGTFGSRTLTAKDVDAAGNETTLKDEEGNLLSAIAANTVFVINSNRMRLTANGTSGASSITVECVKLW